MEKELYLILHNIRSAYNVGSIMRTSDGAGVKKIYLTGYTPSPAEEKLNSNKGQRRISKTALGAEKSVIWEKEKDIFKLLEKLKKEKVEIISLECDARSVDFRKAKYKSPCALILGNEVTGIEEDILSKSDIIAEIPMRGQKESLNVAISAGIAIYEILK